MPLYSEYRKNIDAAAAYVLQKMGRKADVAVILGSGLSSYADTAFSSERKEINYADIPHLPITTVSGHRGKLYYGFIGDKFTVCFAGRFHSYEGHAGPIITLLPQLAKAIGCTVYVLTNAAGGTQRGMQTGCLMSIIDHAATARFNPLFGFEAINAKHEHVTAKDFQDKVAKSAYPFTVSSKDIYSPQLYQLAGTIASDHQFVEKTSFELHGQARKVKLHEGTYVFNSGPNYESHEAIRKLVELAPGSVGMSSVPEALAARMLGMHVYGMSLITNLGAGLSDEVLTHEDVKEVADKISGAVQELIGRLISQMKITELPVLKPWGDVSEDFEMVQKQANYTGWDEIEKVAKGLQAKRCIIYPGCKFELYVDGDILFVSSPKTLDNKQASLVLGVCQHLKIADIKVIDKSLPQKTLISAGNVINLTGEHVTVPLRGKHLEYVKGKTLLVVDQLEDPMTNTYIKNLMTMQKIDFATNQSSALYAVLGRLVGMEVVYCSVDQVNEPSKATTVDKWEVPTTVTQFGVFNVEQPIFDHAKTLADKFKGLEIKKAIIFDMKAPRVGQQVTESTNYCGEHKILKIFLDQLEDGSGLTESTLIIRALKFLNIPEVYIVTDKSNVKTGVVIVKDQINITGLNTLRGENCEKFGPRFPDLSQICDKEMATKLGFEQRIVCMNLDCYYEKEYFGTQVFGGALQNLLTLIHQKQKVCAVIVGGETGLQQFMDQFKKIM